MLTSGRWQYGKIMVKKKQTNHFVGLGIVTGLRLLSLVICCDIIIVSFQFAFPRRLSTFEVVAHKWQLNIVTKTLSLLRAYKIK